MVCGAYPLDHRRDCGTDKALAYERMGQDVLGTERMTYMVRLTESLKQWLARNHPDLLFLIGFGHIELFTDEMKEQYLEWCGTDEGRQYLIGGAKYKDPS